MEKRLYQGFILAVVFIPLLATGYAIYLLWNWLVHWQDLALLVAFFIPISLGVTIGFHRMLTHRAFECGPVVRATLLILGSAAMEGPAVLWAANHLKHHAQSDKDDDPHSPVRGLFHAHLGWMLYGKQADPAVWARWQMNDPLVSFISRTFYVWAALGLVLPFVIGGWTGLLWAGLVRMFLTHHITWSVNSICHTFGGRTFETPDRSSNQWLVGLLALGEGWHNNHHAFPRSAFHGLYWYQFDLSGYVIRLLERGRLIWDVQRVRPAAMARKLLRRNEPLTA